MNITGYRSTHILLLVLFITFSFHSVKAQTIDELRFKIDEHNKKIQDLENEIVLYQDQLDEVGKEKQTLENAVRSLDISRNKISTDIRVTENKILTTDFQIKELSIEIIETEDEITKNNLVISETLREMDEIESLSFIEVLLSHNSITEFTDEIESLQRLQTLIRDRLYELVDLKNSLHMQKLSSEDKKDDLSRFKSDLSSQKRGLDINREAKNDLLKQTKSEEAVYQKLLEEKIRLRKAFEKELLQLESELQIAIDPSKIPPSGSGVLLWPLDEIRVTQYFGNTDFATQNPQIYSGLGHNGIDLGAPQGTPVRASLSGTVEATGNTDIVCPNASYGKWILIRHNNGLSTLYAHLSNIAVSKSDIVTTRQVIGNSGNTGYSTGPHLHFTVFATQGVRVSQLKSRVCAGTYTLPIADTKAYLNPLSYL